MGVTVVLGVAWVAVVAVVAGSVAMWIRGQPAGWGRAVTGRCADLIEANTQRWGRPLTAAAWIAAGTVFTFAVCWALGKLAGAVEGAVDRPAFSFFAAHQVGWWDHLNSIVTQMGNGTETQVLTVVAALVFAVLWRKGRWWAPPAIFLVAFLIERFAGKLLAHMVDRGHPPTTLGTWPSGGCARLVLTVGLIIFLYRRWRGLGGGRDAAWWWAALAVLGSIEAYTRVVLLKHWLTDTFGGLAFGSLLLVVMATGFTILDWHGRDVTEPDQATLHPASRD